MTYPDGIGITDRRRFYTTSWDTTRTRRENSRAQPVTQAYDQVATGESDATGGDLPLPSLGHCEVLAMAHSVSCEASTLLVLRYRDTIDVASLVDGAGDALALAATSGLRCVLVDCRAANMQLSTMDIYDLPGRLADLAWQHGLDIGTFKRALLVDSRSPDFEFAENVAVNRGQLVRLFVDEAAARSWLLDSAESGGVLPAYCAPSGRDGGS